MSEFVAQIRAELDLSEAEKKLKSFSDKEHEVKLKTDFEVDDKVTQKTFEETIKKTQKQVKKNPLQVEVKDSTNSIEKLTDSANHLFTMFSGRNVLDFGADKIRESISELKDLNTTLVEIDKTGNLTQSHLSQLANESFDAASKWGALVQNYMSSSEKFSQAGYSNLEEMADLSTMAQTAGQMTEKTATDFLIASDNAWQMKGNVEKLTSVLDGMNSVTNHNALSMSELANGIRVAGSMLANSGLAENQATALVGTGVATTKESGETVARGLRTIIMNLRQVKGETEDGELIDQEKLKKVEETCNSVGVSLKTVKNGIVELRNPVDILRDLSEVYNSLDTMDARRAKITDDIGGKHRSNILSSILTNFEQYDKMLKDYANGEGSAMEEAMKTSDSWAGRLNALSNTWNEFVGNFVQADTMKGGISFLDNMISAFDTLQDKQLFIPTMISSIMGLQNLFTGRGITDVGLSKDGTGSLGKLDVQGKLFGIDFTEIGNWKKHFSEAEGELDRWNIQCLKGRTNVEKFNSSLKDNKDFKDYISTVQDGSASLEGYKKHLSETGVQFEKFSMKSVLANAATGFLVGAGIELALAGVTKVLDDVIHRQDRLAESATEATSAWKDSNNSLNEQIAKYKELKSLLNSGTLTPSEEYETRQQILDIQMQISDQYGEQASGIDLVNGSLQTQLGLLQQISSENAKKTLNENREEYKNAEEQMTDKRKYILGNTRLINQDNLRKDIDNIVKSFEKEGISLEETNDGSGTKTIFFEGDASQADESINGLMNKIEELKSKYTDEDSINILDYILNQSAQSLSENKDILDKNKDSYKTFLQMDMLSKGTGKGSVADIFNQYTEAVEKYNNALSSGDTDNIKKARAGFASLSSEMDNLLSKDENAKYATLFDDVTEQLNNASIKAFDFQEALNGKTGGKNQFGKVSDDIQNASEKLKELKIDAVDALDALVTEGSQTGENELWTLAKAWGLNAESSTEEMQAFIDVLSQTGIVSGEVSGSVEGMSNSFDSFSSTVQKAVSDFETLKSIMSESVSGTGISADNVSAFRDMFGADADKALEKTANGYHLNKTALAELQAQMGEMTKADYLSALSDQYTELQNIEGQIAAAEILGQDTSGLEASRNGILENISSLQDLQYQYEAATSAYQQWQSAMSGGEEGDMYDAIYGNIEKASEFYEKGLTGTNKFKEFTDLMSNKDLSTASNEEIVIAYEEALPKIQRYFTEGQEGAQNFLTDIQNLNSEWAHMNEDGSWDINFGIGNDQEIADNLGIDVEAVQSIMRKLTDYGFEINLDESIASLETLKAQAESANESLKGMGDDLQINLGADSFEGVESQISSLKEYISEVQDSDLELDVKTDKLDAANSILEYLVTRKQELGKSENVDITLNIDESELQAGYDTLNQLKSSLESLQGKVGIDTAGLQTEINNCVAQIESMSPEMKVALGIQGMSVDQIKSGLMDGSIEVPVNADTSQADSKIDGVKNNKIEDKNVTVTANTAQAVSALSSVRSYLSGITSKTVTVTVNKVTNESKSGSGKIQGTAHVQGTAFVGGNWGNPVAGKKLVGELGREIIVDPHTGHWYTVGDNGAEFTEVPKDAIVFNHLQSENLLKNGHVLGRGQALASGTAYSSGSGRFNVGGSGSKSYSSSVSNKSSNTANTNTSSAASSLAKAAEDLKDFVEIYLDRASDLTQKQIDAIDRAVGLADKQNQNAKAISNVQSEITKNRQAYDRYMQQANSVGLSESYASQIRDGSLNIENITDETLSKNIKSYEEW